MMAGGLGALGQNGAEEMREAGVEVVGAEFVIMGLAEFGGMDDTGLTQDAQVVGEGAARRFGADIAAGKAAVFGEFANDGKTGGIAQSMQDLGEIEVIGLGVIEIAHAHSMACLVTYFQ